jgi:hypothetical protein
MFAEPLETCVQIRSVRKMLILSLNLFATATKRNYLAVFPHSFDRGTVDPAKPNWREYCWRG